MATLKTQPFGTEGMNLSDLDIRLLGNFGSWSTSSTSARFYDDSSNYALFTGKGFKFKTVDGALEAVTGGTITKFELVVEGTKIFAFSGLNLSAAKIYDFYVDGDLRGALNALLAGNDTISGTRYADVLFGGRGDDALSGGAGNDTLKGDAGDDKLYGGAGRDKLTGGGGEDRFVFKSAADSRGSTRDTISDFKQSEKDRIDLRAIDASAKAGDQAFKFIGTNAFHDKAGELRFERKAGDTIVHGDIDGDGKADFSIVIDASINLKASDFIL